MTLPATATVTTTDEVTVIRRVRVDFVEENYRPFLESAYRKHQPKLIIGFTVRWDWDFEEREWHLNAIRVVTRNALKSGELGAESTLYLTGAGYKDYVLLSMIGSTKPEEYVESDVIRHRPGSRTT